MKRIIRLTESDLTRIVRRVVKESKGFLNENAQTKGSQYYAANKSKVDAAYNALNSLVGDGWIDDDDIDRVAGVLSSNITTGAAYVGLCFKLWNSGINGSSPKSLQDFVNEIRPCSISQKDGYGVTGGGSQLWGSLTGKESHNETLHGSVKSARDEAASMDEGMWKSICYSASPCQAPKYGGQFAK